MRRDPCQEARLAHRTLGIWFTDEACPCRTGKEQIDQVERHREPRLGPFTGAAFREFQCGRAINVRQFVEHMHQIVIHLQPVVVHQTDRFANRAA